MEPGETAVVIEDVITTGGSTRDVIEVLRAAGANVVAAGSIIDRSGGHADVGVPRVALATMHVAAHYPESAPCAAGHSRGETGLAPRADAPHPHPTSHTTAAAFTAGRSSPACPPFRACWRRSSPDIEGAPVHVAGSGRTDAGVHALAQVAAFSLANPIPLANLRRAMNRLLPPAIRVLAAEEVAPDFHPRFDAKAKTYEYRILRERSLQPFRVAATCITIPIRWMKRMVDWRAPSKASTISRAFAAADDRDAEGQLEGPHASFLPCWSAARAA